MSKKYREWLALPVYLLGACFWVPTTFFTWAAQIIAGDAQMTARHRRILGALGLFVSGGMMGMFFHHAYSDVVDFRLRAESAGICLSNLDGKCIKMSFVAR